MALAQQLLDAGLIQFGWFRRGDETLPFTLHLDMLASYPDILKQVVDEAQAALTGISATRLLCSADSLPLGVVYSQSSGIPLVYSRGASELPVFDLVGAYDIDHPTLLLANSLGWEPIPVQLISGARLVGLEIHTVLTILETRPTKPADGLTIIPLLRLSEVVRDLSVAGRLPHNHAQAVQDWLTV